MPTTAPGGSPSKPVNPDPFGINIPGFNTPDPTGVSTPGFGTDPNTGKGLGSGVFTNGIWGMLGINPSQFRALAIRGGEILLGASICIAGAAVVVSGSKTAQGAVKAVAGVAVKGAETAAVA